MGFTEGLSAPCICASFCRPPPSLPCGSMQRVHVDVRINEPPGWIHKCFFFFFSLSLSTPPPSVSVCVAGPDPPLSSHTMTHTRASSTTLTGKRIAAYHLCADSPRCELDASIPSLRTASTGTSPSPRSTHAAVSSEGPKTGLIQHLHTSGELPRFLLTTR